LATYGKTAFLQQRARVPEGDPVASLDALTDPPLKVGGLPGLVREVMPGERTYTPGSKEDFDRLYQDNYQVVFRTVYAILGDISAAEDCTQDAFLSAFKAWGRWKADAPPGAWLHRIAINAAISHRRRHRIRDLRELVRRLGPQADPDPTAQADDSVLLAELRRLPTKQAAALVLRHLHGYTNREIAAALQVPESTIASRLMEAKRTLRRRLAARSDDEDSDTSGRFSVRSCK
jgi:RNA polymerase sigma-70 factor (ECF subfamily)